MSFDSLNPALTEFQTSWVHFVHYIAGFVKRKLSATVKCKTCAEIIRVNPTVDKNGLTFIKDRGGLMYVSSELVKIAEIAESKIQVAKMNDRLFSDRQILNRICLQTLSTCLTQHPEIFEKADHRELHKYSLMKETVLLYTVLRLKYLSKEKNFDVKKSRIR